MPCVFHPISDTRQIPAICSFHENIARNNIQLLAQWPINCRTMVNTARSLPETKQLCRCDVSMALQAFVGPWPIFSVLTLYTDGRTPWTGYQPVASPLPTHRKTQAYMPRVRFEPTIPVVRASEDSSCPRRRPLSHTALICCSANYVFTLSSFFQPVLSFFPFQSRLSLWRTPSISKQACQYQAQDHPGFHVTGLRAG
jgi:hypothetical protein